MSSKVSLTINVQDAQSGDKPIASFSIVDFTNNSIAPSQYTFQSTSQNSDALFWCFEQFPCGGFDEEDNTNPTFIYDKGGTYRVTLIALNTSNNMRDTIDQIININDIITFREIYGKEDKRQEGVALLETRDGNLVLIGNTNANEGMKDNILFIKIDPNNPGVLINENNYGGIQDEAAFDVVEKDDSGFIIVGKSDSYGQNQGNDNADVYIVVTNNAGDDMKTSEAETIFFGNEKNDEVRSVINTDIGYAIAGSGRRTNDQSGNADILLSVLDEDGQRVSGYQQNKFFGSEENENGYDLIEVDEEFIVVGNSFGVNDGPGYLVRIKKSSGEEISGSERSFDADGILKIIRIENNLFLLGERRNQNAVIFKTDLSGNTISVFEIKDSEFELIPRDMIVTRDNKIAITGTAELNDDGIIFITVYDPDLNMTLFTNKIFGINNCNASGNSIIQTGDGGYAIIGSCDQDILLVKTNNKGEIN